MKQANYQKFFVPICRGYGAHLTGKSPDEWRSNTNSFIGAVRLEQSLLKADLQILDSDPTWLAAALGCQVRMVQPFQYTVVKGLPAGGSSRPSFSEKQLLTDDVFASLKEILTVLCREGRRVASLLPGPWTFARQIACPNVPSAEEWEDLLDESVQFLASVTRTLLQTGCQEVVFWEDLDGEDPSMIPDFYGSLYNVVAHFKGRVWIIAQGDDPSVVQYYNNPSVSGVLFPDIEPQAFFDIKPIEGLSLGAGIPKALLTGDSVHFEKELASVADKYQISGVPILCPLISHDAIPEKVLKLVGTVHGSQVVA